MACCGKSLKINRQVNFVACSDSPVVLGVEPKGKKEAHIGDRVDESGDEGEQPRNGSAMAVAKTY
jgi:hypothetical protein